jgi:anti-sigma factor RsiW
MRCREVRRLEYLDGELAPVARREVSGRIDHCRACEHLESLVASSSERARCRDCSRARAWLRAS